MRRSPNALMNRSRATKAYLSAQSYRLLRGSAWPGLGRLLGGIVRRGPSMVEAKDRSLPGDAHAVPSVIEAIAQAIKHAEFNREHGMDVDEQKAISAASRAGSSVREVVDVDAHRLTLHWKSRFEAVPNG
jgi:hypothetical protein